MDALLRPEELEWRDKTRRFVDEHVRPVIEDDFERGHFRREIVRGLGELGVLGMHLSGYGCAGASAVSYGLACLEMEAGDTAWRTFVSVQGSLAMSAIRKFGSEEQKQRWLPGLAAGELIGCFGLTEPGGGSNPAGMTTYARRDGSDWILEGRKRWIGLGSLADVAVVWAKTDDGYRGFLVPAGTPGFTAHDITNKLSLRTSVQCDLVFDGVRLPDEAVLPDVKTLRGPFTCLNEARYGIIWGVLGAARSCLDAALEYSREREVFGRPIAEFQLTQAKLADSVVELEKGLLLALHIGRRKDEGRLAPEQISVGKLNNVREASEIARTARTILGGEGVTSRFPVMRHMANLESVRTYEGTDEIHTLVIGHALTGLRAFA
ncbi:MAG: acyl-CoA dehydrogenase family protein [Actinomycetota bacterium]|nr:acyl-CoA dehydrogenase family protein [Actinomycetota bacterium]